MRSRLLFGTLVTALLAFGCGETDPGITTSVKSRLVADDMVKARRIDVDTKDRIVTLRGEVRTTEEESQALQIARETKGVTNVIDQLTVVPEAAPTTGVPPGEPGYYPTVPTDPEITAAVKAKLLLDPDTSGLRIDVDTNKRVVTLTGTVKSEAEKTEALRIARELEGVANVIDRLTIERPK
jgi:hyperosmotically inducible protein